MATNVAGHIPVHLKDEFVSALATTFERDDGEPPIAFVERWFKVQVKQVLRRQRREDAPVTEPDWEGTP